MSDVIKRYVCLLRVFFLDGRDLPYEVKRSIISISNRGLALGGHRYISFGGVLTLLLSESVKEKGCLTPICCLFH